jgi:hypothetical protein
MDSSSQKPRHAPALEVELTKGANGKVRSIRISVGSGLVLLLLGLSTAPGVPWHAALDYIAALVRHS